MKNLIIDRFEGIYAICEDAEKRLFAIETGELPKESGEGDVLKINDDGTVAVDAEATAARRKKIKGKQDKLFK